MPLVPELSYLWLRTPCDHLGIDYLLYNFR